MDAYGDLGSLGLAGMVRLSAALRDLAGVGDTVADFAQAVCQHLHTHLVDEAGTRQTALVRFYGTAPYSALPAAERAWVGVPTGAQQDPTCLVLLGTVGNEPDWNDRTRSSGHRVLALGSAGRVAQLPMVAALMSQLGVSVPSLLDFRAPVVAGQGQQRCGVFHVPRAQYSPAVPAQDFVTEHGIESVLGFGGVLPTGEVYAVVIFAVVPVPVEAAKLFETVALSTTLASLAMLSRPLLPGADRTGRALPAGEQRAARESVVAELLRVHERVAVVESEAATRSLERVTLEVERYAALAGRLRLAQDAAQLGLWEWEVASGKVTWDRHCATLFGAQPEELLGEMADFDDRCHPDDLQRIAHRLAEIAVSGGDLELEYRAVLPDGSVRRHLSRGHAVSDEVGRVEVVVGAVLDVTELRAAADARSGLASVALQLARAGTAAEVNEIVVVEGLAALGAASGGVLVRAEDGRSVQATSSADLGRALARRVATLAIDVELASVHTARTGQQLVFGNLADLVEAFPAEAEAEGQRDGRPQAVACLPLRVQDRFLGALTATWTMSRALDAGELELVGALAAQCAQALDRVMSEESERRSVAAVRSMSEALQRSMLTSPPQPRGLELAVRYRPAARELEIGGDWYDAFVTADGATWLVVGDVTGHDRDAAAAMGQVRNLLRGAAYTAQAGPAVVLAALEATMEGLQVAALATLVLARLAVAGADGSRVLQWCNAGHPPPLLVGPAGAVEVLEREPDLVLGMFVGARWHDHEVRLAAGDTVLLYTDGLVERRREHLDDGIHRLALACRELAHHPPSEVCDTLLAELVPDGAADDVALLMVRLLPG